MTDDSYRVIVTGSGRAIEQDIQIGQHTLHADEPVAAGGTDRGPDPYALLLAALGSCTSMTIGLYARRKGIALERSVVSLRHSKEYATDCENCESQPRRIDTIDRKIELVGDLTEEQRAALMAIADKCPVHRTLTSEIRIRTVD